MKQSLWRWRRVVENRCIFSARLKTLSDSSGDHSAGGRQFHVAGQLTAKLRCPVAIRARGVPVAGDRRCWWPVMAYGTIVLVKLLRSLYYLQRIQKKLLALQENLPQHLESQSPSSNLVLSHRTLETILGQWAAAQRHTWTTMLQRKIIQQTNDIKSHLAFCIA